MTEREFLNAQEIYSKLAAAKIEYENVDGLLNLSPNITVSLKSSPSCIAADCKFPTFIKFTDEEKDEAIGLLKSMRLKKVEDMERELEELLK